MDELIVEAVLAVFGAVLAVLTGIILYRYRQRQVSDKEALEHWYVAFDRMAFRGPYLWHSNQEKFRRAIDATIKSINTGVLLEGSGKEVDSGKGKPKSRLRKAAWRSKMDEIVARLNRVRQLIAAEPEGPDPELAAEIDAQRDEVIRTFNSLLEEAGINRRLPIPTEVQDYDQVIGGDV